MDTSSVYTQLQELDQRLTATTSAEDLQQWKNTADTLLAQLRIREQELLTEVAQYQGFQRNIDMLVGYRYQNRLRHIEHIQDEARRQAELLARGPTSIPELCEVLTNDHQKQALRKLTFRGDEYQIYLSTFEPNTSTERRLANVVGSFTVLGTMKAGVRESYKVQIYKPGTYAKGSFWCSCPDHKFNSTKKNMVCKHICFLVCRVGRIFSPDFFESKHFTEEQHAAFLTKIDNAALFQDRTICRSEASTASLVAGFQTITKPVTEDDLCPICYDGMCGSSDSGSGSVDIVTCPTCTNNLHKDCMKVWLERQQTCVFCRSDVWKHYR